MRKKTKYLIILILLLCLTSTVTYSVSYAKYVSNHAWNYYLGTKGFYFNSEQLGFSKITNVNNNWNSDSTYFRIKNSENDFLVTDYDIEYTVKCTIQNDAADYSRCSLNGTGSDMFSGVLSASSSCKNSINALDVSMYNKDECESNGYEWNIQENYKDLYFDIIKTGDEEIDYVSVLIEVSSTAPYTKTLLGEFNLSSIEIEENGLKVDYMEFDNYSRVVVSNSYDENKCVRLNWNSDNLRIDNINRDLSFVQYDDGNIINGINFNIGKRDSVSYIFYKTDFSKVYDSKEFNLIESYDC